MKIETKMLVKLFSLIILIFLNTLIFAQTIKEQTLQDSSGTHKKHIQIQNQDFIRKDIFGNPILEKETKDFSDKDKDKEEQKEEAESYIFGIGLLVFASPIYLPIKLLEDDYSEKFYYQKYPFEKGDGFTEFDGKRWMGNLTFSYQYVDKNIVGYKVNSSLRFLRFTFEPSYSFYSNPKGEENISKFNTTIKFTFAQNQFINFRTGLGYSHFETDSKFDGINWIYEICLFQKPFNIRLNYNLTGYNFKSKEKVSFNNNFNINFGYFFKNFNLTLGYRWNKMGKEKLNSPEISSSFWF